MNIFGKKPQYQVLKETPDYILIMDTGPWDEYPSITNCVEDVLYDLRDKLKGRQLFYIDSEHKVDEIKYSTEIIFQGFKPGYKDYIEFMESRREKEKEKRNG